MAGLDSGRMIGVPPSSPVSRSLPEDGEASIAGVRLPAGKRIWAGGRSGRPGSHAVATGKFGDVAGSWIALRERLDGTGLVLLLLSDLPDLQVNFHS